MTTIRFIARRTALATVILFGASVVVWLVMGFTYCETTVLTFKTTVITPFEEQRGRLEDAQPFTPLPPRRFWTFVSCSANPDVPNELAIRLGGRANP